MSCSGGERYHIIGNIIDGDSKSDSVQLWIYDQGYNGLRLIQTSSIIQNSFEFDGINDKPHAAILKLNRDSVNYFIILDNTPLKIELGNNKYKVIDGSQDNNDWSRILKIKNGIIADRAAINARYLKLSSDTLLTDSMEIKLLTQYNMLGDSLTRVIKGYDTIASPISFLVKSMKK